MKTLIVRLYITIAAALTFTLAVISVYAGIWQLAIVHVFVLGALMCAYLRPMEAGVLEEVMRGMNR